MAEHGTTGREQGTDGDVTPSAADARVLGVGRTAPLLLLTQQISTATGTPFEHSRILFRGDKIRLEFHYDL